MKWNRVWQCYKNAITNKEDGSKEGINVLLIIKLLVWNNENRIVVVMIFTFVITTLWKLIWLSIFKKITTRNYIHTFYAS